MNYIRKFNTIFNKCNIGETVVLERFGKIHSYNFNYFWSIPLVDKIKIVKRQPIDLDIFIKNIETIDEYKINISSKAVIKPQNLSKVVKRHVYMCDIERNETVRNCIKNVISEKEFRTLLFHDDDTEKILKKYLGNVYLEMGYNLEQFIMKDVKVIKKGKHFITSGSRGCGNIATSNKKIFNRKN